MPDFSQNFLTDLGRFLMQTPDDLIDTEPDTLDPGVSIALSIVIAHGYIVMEQAKYAEIKRLLSESNQLIRDAYDTAQPPVFRDASKAYSGRRRHSR